MLNNDDFSLNNELMRIKLMFLHKCRERQRMKTNVEWTTFGKTTGFIRRAKPIKSLPDGELKVRFIRHIRCLIDIRNFNKVTVHIRFFKTENLCASVFH